MEQDRRWYLISEGWLSHEKVLLSSVGNTLKLVWNISLNQWCIRCYNCDQTAFQYKMGNLNSLVAISKLNDFFWNIRWCSVQSLHGKLKRLEWLFRTKVVWQIPLTMEIAIIFDLLVKVYISGFPSLNFEGWIILLIHQTAVEVIWCLFWPSYFQKNFSMKKLK